MSNNLFFAMNQRWISDTEPELGLGIITEVGHRTITVAFRASAQTRQYATANAPLSRLRLHTGDQLLLGKQNEQYTVVLVDETPDHTYIYQLEHPEHLTRRLPESLLPDTLGTNSPKERLFSGQLGSHQWFYLKQQALRLFAEAHASGLTGLTSARVELIPHQLYIASEVATRHAPRVMLADEVGLGKTIEAGLIMQHQLVSGLVKRVLIITPEPLINQWMVEMLRRFNLHFSILDAGRCQALSDGTGLNPFLTSQLVLTSYNLLETQPEWASAASEAGWDLCIVDEAHRAELDSDNPLQQLGQTSKGLLLLTATPEQLGMQRHFRLLQLLDPSRFSSFSQFEQEQSDYQHLVQRINKLPAGEQSRILTRELLDQAGTGRILFRNTRRALKGFPGRSLFSYALDATSINPEEMTDDARVRWLVDWISNLPEREKVLLICTEDASVIALEKYLRRRAGIACSAFHRGMNLLERDRAAAYFADTDNPGKVLICSEIGSEGRNFQFCRHLVLFDLPENPELLEQRIGRLDRIGQKTHISVHVPYLRGSAQEVLFRWYQQGLDAFEQVSPAAFRLWQEHACELAGFIERPETMKEPGFQALLEKVCQQRATLVANLEKGRDRLLELNSFDAQKAATIKQQIVAFEQQCDLKPWMITLLDQFNIHHETNSDGSLSIVPSEDMLIPCFPGLADDGIEACFDRQCALLREDRAFLNWQHPMILGAYDLTLTDPLGKACVSGSKMLPEGCLLLQCLYRLKMTSSSAIQAQRYLTQSSWTVSVPHNNTEQLTELNIDEDELQRSVKSVNKVVAAQLIAEQQSIIHSLLRDAESSAGKIATGLIAKASQTMLSSQTTEIKRLLALQQRNPNIRPEEIDFLKNRTLALHDCLSQAVPELVAIHLVIGI
ncbi:SNF2-related protein [Pseudohongiella spirulinae]|uniref:RNA polymerase-associated protein RapA n=1 Tax=Pseudohongiella spirulinae TaxID=1249552 RepID=A0A0S2KCG6_9GAMM|nr:SNF2-related protein [Pseudohongiella spirulinae]ALO46032.1 helicase SNF2 [Pseudohongiella spirulinae]